MSNNSERNSKYLQSIYEMSGHPSSFDFIIQTKLAFDKKEQSTSQNVFVFFNRPTYNTESYEITNSAMGSVLNTLFAREVQRFEFKFLANLVTENRFSHWDHKNITDKQY
mmetsp:Transcript_25601/g.39388  ORF Transcript_25601/g.39388 Transcript_25601/m.39388 type:complete len:110 (+) Transcript_25601:768-1097(+)